MELTKKINFRESKYMIPALIYFPLLFTGYFVIDMIGTKKAETVDPSMQTTEYLNPNLPQMISQAHSEGLYTIVSTNAQAMTEPMAERLTTTAPSATSTGRTNPPLRRSTRGSSRNPRSRRWQVRTGPCHPGVSRRRSAEVPAAVKR